MVKAKAIDGESRHRWQASLLALGSLGAIALALPATATNVASEESGPLTEAAAQESLAVGDSQGLAPKGDRSAESGSLGDGTVP
jgi:hypothetical protein